MARRSRRAWQPIGAKTGTPVIGVAITEDQVHPRRLSTGSGVTQEAAVRDQNCAIDSRGCEGFVGVNLLGGRGVGTIIVVGERGLDGKCLQKNLDFRAVRAAISHENFECILLARGLCL